MRPARGPRRALAAAVVGLGLWAACGDEPPTAPAPPPEAVPDAPDAAPAEDADPDRPTFPEVSFDAKLDTFESLVLDLDAPRHASDGGGRARLERVEVADDAGAFEEAARDADGQPMVVVGRQARFHLVYEAGPDGVADGGYVFLQASPFWDWATPQPDWADGNGYTEIDTDAEGVELEAAVAAEQLLAVRVGGRALAPGERISIVYGAGAAGASVDRYAEREAALWFAVDGDGDGVRAIVPDSPTVRVVAGPPARLRLTLSTTARPGDAVRLSIAVLDVLGNAGVDWAGEVALDVPEGLELPARVRMSAEDRGVRTVDGAVRAAGVFRVTGTAALAPVALEAESNPLVSRADVRTVRWADLHGHSNLSDGTGTPEDYYAYARDVAALDVAALTDHDHWGMRFLDATPELWERIRNATAAHHEPGRFVTLLGYEWTSWLQGHRHVLYFDSPTAPGRGLESLLSSMDPAYQTPDQLWEALDGQPALTFAHHSAGGPISTNWTYAPPPSLEPVTEIVSVHGSSEAPDSPGVIYQPAYGNFVRDALALGYRFGFIGSGDSHDGHPGLASIATGDRLGGLAAIRTDALTRDAVLAALRARRTYATNGARIFLDVRLDGGTLSYEVAATAPIERIDFIRGGLTATVPGEGQRDVTGAREIPPLGAGEYLYLRVVQEDGGAAWSSPIYPAPIARIGAEEPAGDAADDAR